MNQEIINHIIMLLEERITEAKLNPSGRYSEGKQVAYRDCICFLMDERLVEIEYDQLMAKEE